MRKYLFLPVLLAVCVAGSAADERTSENNDQIAKFFKRFPRADQNRDGVLTWDEAIAHREAEKQRRSTAPGPAPVAPTKKDVRYGRHARNLIDFYAVESKTPSPVVIFWHGGGFVAGDKGSAGRTPIAGLCRENGIAFISGNYRFVRGEDSEPFPGSLMDGVRTVQYVRSRAKEWNIDPDRIVLSGSSAGAVMSLWIAMHDDFADPDSKDPLARISSRVRGVVGYGGPTTMDPAVIVKRVPGNPDIHGSLGPIFGVESASELLKPEHRAKVAEFSPVTHVSQDDPRLFLKYGMALSDQRYNIHHSKFGLILLERFQEIGHASPPLLVCPEGPDAGAAEIDYLKEVFGLK